MEDRHCSAPHQPPGEELGYIIPAYDFRTSDSMSMEDWNYEETMSLGPATGPVIVEAALRLLASPGPR